MAQVATAIPAVEDEATDLVRNEGFALQWPGEIYAWNAIVQCYPAYGGSR